MAEPLEALYASNGDGPAVRGTVSAQRLPTDMDLITDSVLNWPHKGIATSGTPDEDGVIIPDTECVFSYVLSGTIIHITGFAPGYEDVGHEENQIVILKPTTYHTDSLVEAIGEGGASVTIGDTPPPDPKEGDLWGQTGSSAVASLAAMVGSVLMPVGFSMITQSSSNPATYLGFGTWVQDAKGQAIVGVDTAQTEFNEVNKTGGSKTHTLTVNEMPSHNHTQNPHNHSYTGGYNSSRLGANGSYWSLQGDYSTGSTTATNNPTGGGAAHNNLQPYKTKYIWTRTA